MLFLSQIVFLDGRVKGDDTEIYVKIDLNFKFLSADEESAEAVADVTAASMQLVNHKFANILFRKTSQP